MGEIFEKAVATSTLNWTGERLTSAAVGQVEIEHLHRYILARDLCRDLDVLDIASGEGYGAALLAQTARSVIGVEIDAEAVAHSRASYLGPKTTFVLGDARAIPLGDASVDVVVSFETIEHFYEQEVFLAEVRRVLRRGGRFIVSSPERNAYSPTAAPPNPFHKRELTRQEFIDLLRSMFSEIRLYGQRPVLGSLLFTEAPGSGRLRTIERRGPTQFESSEGFPRPLYLVAVASDVSLDDTPNSLFIETDNIEAGLVELPAVQAELGRVKKALDEAGRYARSLEALNAAIQSDRNGIVDQRDALSTQLAAATRHIRHVQSECNAVLADRSEVRKECEVLPSELETSSAHARRLEDELTREKNPHLSIGQGVSLDPSQNPAEPNAARLEAIVAYAQAMRRDRQVNGPRREELEREVAELVARLEHQTALVEQLSRAADGQRKAREAVEEHLSIVETSTIWRVSEPVRQVGRRFPIGARLGRWAVRGAWFRSQWRASPRLPESPMSSELGPVPDSFEEILSVGCVAMENGSDTTLVRVGSAPNFVRTDLAAAKAALTEKLQHQLSGFLDGIGIIAFPQLENPAVSVVIVVHDRAYFTLKCLLTLKAEHAEELEVILVDNASSDETGLLLSRVENLKIIRNSSNQGFLKAANQGARAARGKSLLMLNNDAFPRQGAIACALKTLLADKTIGAVGGQLVYPTGRLQEAGSIIFRDGSTYGYGRDLAPNDGEVMFRRDVDYVSGAFLLTRKETFELLDGFDEQYSPAYFEDADYCMRVQKTGMRVVFEPMAIIDHFEWGSDENSNRREELSRRNRRLFRARHATSLARHHLPPAVENLLPGRTAAPARRRLLFIENDVPLSELGSGYPRAREILSGAVAAGWDVTLFPLHRLEIDILKVRAEIPWEVEIIAGHGAPRVNEFLERRAGYYDTILISRPDNMAFLRQSALGRPPLLECAKVIYDAEAIFALREIKRRTLIGLPMSAIEAESLIANEIALADASDAIICVSEVEAKVFRERLPTPVHVLGHAIRLRHAIPDFSQRRGFLFIGRLLDRDVPNWDGLAWFISKVWPQIRRSITGATLTVVGHLNADHDDLRGPGIRLVGAADGLDAFYDAARIFLAPVRFAAGLPLKIIEASAAGVPVIGTRLMQEQLGWVRNVEIAAEDDPAALAGVAVALHEDGSAWAAQSVKAKTRVSREYGVESFRGNLRALLDSSEGSASAAEKEEAHRANRVRSVWGSAPPSEATAQWATFPLSHPVIQAAMNRRATGNAALDPYGRLIGLLRRWEWTLPVSKAVSLCCGAGAIERGLVENGLLADCVGYDLAEGALDVARQAATAKGYQCLSYEQRDLERDGLEQVGLDLVIAHQALHHLSRLEQVCDAVYAALRAGGVFHIHEFVGPDRFQWTDRQLVEMTGWVASLPERYRLTPSGQVKTEVGRATLEEMMAYDPSEAVRSSEIERIVNDRFEVVDRRALGGTLSMMALADIGQNFDPEALEDCTHLRRLLDREDELIRTGELGSDFVTIVGRRP